MARSGGSPGGTGGGVGAFVLVVFLIWLVVTFWYVFVGIAVCALAVSAIVYFAKAHEETKTRAQNDREALRKRCIDQNRQYVADPVAYMRRLQADM